MVELVKKLAGLLRPKDLFFESFEARRLVAVDVPKEVNVELNYDGVARRREGRRFDAITTFVATVTGLEAAQVAKITCVIRVEYVIPDCPETKDVPITDELVKALAESQAIYTAYPYFREYLQGACSRLSLPPIFAPPLMGRALFERLRAQEAKKVDGKKTELKAAEAKTNVVPLKPTKHAAG